MLPLRADAAPMPLRRRALSALTPFSLRQIRGATRAVYCHCHYAILRLCFAIIFYADADVLYADTLITPRRRSRLFYALLPPRRFEMPFTRAR